jgi:tetratricopeptide (TPR) repeat protein
MQTKSTLITLLVGVVLPWTCSAAAQAGASLATSASTPPTTAEDYYNRAQERYRAATQWDKNLMKKPLAKGALEDIIADCTKAIQLKPDYGGAYSSRAFAKAAQGDLDGALADITKAIELKPDWRAYEARASWESERGDLEGAIADYTKTIQLLPNYPNAYSFRGAAKEAKCDFGGAIADFEEAIKLGERGGLAESTLAAIRSGRVSKPAGAQAVWKKAKSSNTIEAYSEYLRRTACLGEHATEAREHLKSLMLADLASTKEIAPTPPPRELAELPQDPTAYRSNYVIAEIMPTEVTKGDNVDGKVDASIEATSVPGTFLFNGLTAWTIEGRSLNWEAGARHTIKGKITIMGYTIVSDPSSPLVFRTVSGKGYVYEKGRGVVITPLNEHVFLQSK